MAKTKLKKVKLTAGQLEVFDVLAHIEVVSRISKNVEGSSGLYDHYMKTALTDRQRSIFEQFGEHYKKVNRDLAAMLAKDKDNAQG